MGQSESMTISEISPRQIKITLPNKKNISFVRGKRNTEGEILSDRDFFYFTLFRCLELYSWKYNHKLGGNSKSNSSPREDSPRLKKFDSVMQLTSLFRKNQTTEDIIEYIDKSNYQSEIKEEILLVIGKLVSDYITNKDASKTSLAIDTYVSDLKIDKFPHYINYRPNRETDLSIALCFSLGFYKSWLSLPHSWLYPHEWEYLLQQNIWLLDEIDKDKTYLDVMLDNGNRFQNNEISVDQKLVGYTYMSIYTSLRQPQNKNREYLNKLIKNLRYNDGLVSRTVITWYCTFNS